MSDFAVLCVDCYPVGGCEVFTVGLMGNQRCDRCGANRGKLLAVAERHLWPRPIPVAERLPEALQAGDSESESVMVFVVDEGAWFQAHYDSMFAEWRFPNGAVISTPRLVSHWMPMPPRPLTPKERP
jgi:hypothetical protein